MRVIAYATPPLLMVAWMAIAAILAPNGLRWFDLVYAGTTVLVTGSLVTGAVLGVVAYRRSSDALTRSGELLRWIAGGSIAATVIEYRVLASARDPDRAPAVAGGAIGLAGLPFVVGWRSRCVAISSSTSSAWSTGRLVYVHRGRRAGGQLCRAGGSAGQWAGPLRNTAAALAAAAVALALAPLRGLAQRGVNRLMYGHRDDPARVLDDLGTRLQAVLLPERCAARRGRGRGRLAAGAVRRGRPGRRHRRVPARGRARPAVGREHETALIHHGETVGRLRVSGRGRDDPLDATDLALIDALVQQVGPAVEAVRLHEDLVRSRAAVVASGRTSGAGFGATCTTASVPSLAAIRLKAGLAARRCAGRVADPDACWTRSAPRWSRASPTSGGWSTRSARRPWTSSAWSGPSAPARHPWPGSRVHGDRAGPAAAAAGCGRDRRVPDRGRGDDQRRPAQSGAADVR